MTSPGDRDAFRTSLPPTRAAVTSARAARKRVKRDRRARSAPPTGLRRGWYEVAVDIEDSRCRGGGKGRRDHHACPPVQDGDERVDPLAAQDGREFRAPGRQLADRSRQVDVGDLPGVTVPPHQIVDGDRLAVRFDDTGMDEGAGSVRLYASDLQRLA